MAAMTKLDLWSLQPSHDERVNDKNANAKHKPELQNETTATQRKNEQQNNRRTRKVCAVSTAANNNQKTLAKREQQPIKA